MITLETQSERGVLKARFEVSPFFDRVLPVAWSRSTGCCLRFIDPYGHTTFNQLQLPVLIEELAALRPYLSAPSDVERLGAVLQFLAAAVDQPHIYVTFIGD